MSSAADTTANSSTIPKGRTKAYTAYKQMKLKYNAKELAPTPYTQYQAQNLVCGIYASFKRMETLRQLEVNFLQRSLKWSYFEMIWFETERDWLVHMKERERLTLELLKLEDRMLFTRERHQQPASNSTSSESKLKRGVPGFINGQKACAIADTGAGNNIISESLARQMNLTIEPSTTTFRIGNRERVKSVGEQHRFAYRLHEAKFSAFLTRPLQVPSPLTGHSQTRSQNFCLSFVTCSHVVSTILS